MVLFEISWLQSICKRLLLLLFWMLYIRFRQDLG